MMGANFFAGSPVLVLRLVFIILTDYVTPTFFTLRPTYTRAPGRLVLYATISTRKATYKCCRQSGKLQRP